MNEVERYGRSISRLLSQLKEKPVKRVLFVCLGNICRSPAAEGLLRHVVEAHGAQDRWVIDSCGTGGYHTGDLPDKRMRVHARQRGYMLDHRARKVKIADFDDFDLIIPMDSANADDLRLLAPTAEAARKIVPMAAFVTLATRFDHIPDPYYEGSEGFELVLDLLENATANLFETLNDNQ